MSAFRPAAKAALSLGLSLALLGSAQAGVVWFTDRTAWTAAVGGLSFSEDFSSFVTDQSFQLAPVALNGMSIQREGLTDNNFRNLVEAPPAVFGDNNGTAHASMYTNAGEQQVRITFSALNRAFGGESWDATGSEGAVLEIFDGASLLGSHELAGGRGAFLGYILDGGDSASSVRFSSILNIAGPSGEGFGYDNLAGANAQIGVVPVPGTVALAGLGLLALGAARRRQSPR